jgi:glycerophosphoryl diester phosphodiesterase
VELKSGREIITPLAAVLAESDLDPEQLRILSFDAALIAKVKRLLPRYKACWLTGYRWSTAGGWRPSQEEVLVKLQQAGADGLASRARSVVDKKLVAALRFAGKEIHIWTVDDAAEAGRLQDLGIDSIMTNRPGWMRNMLASSRQV